MGRCDEDKLANNSSIKPHTVVFYFTDDTVSFRVPSLHESYALVVKEEKEEKMLNKTCLYCLEVK